MSIALTSSEPDQDRSKDSLEADSLASGLSFMLGANIVQRAIGFIRNLALCRFLTDEHLGLWALTSSFFVLAAPFAVFGLPGTLGRMVSSYQTSGQLNVFLKRIAIGTTVGALCFASAISMAPSASSFVIFGVELSRSTMMLLALALCLVILFNSITELLSGLRKPLIVSAMHSCNSLSFTVASFVGVLMHKNWQVLIIASAIASVAGLIPAIPAFRNWPKAESDAKPTLSHRAMWKRVLPFAISIWCMNLLTNLFDVVDRYMLLHLASQTAEQGRALVGQFHSGRIMPSLLSSLALVLGGMLLPYLASEWETGDKRKVANSLRLTLKCSSIFFVALSIASISVAPLLFKHVLQGKYDGGLEIMPQAMLHCCLAAITCLMQNYFWCAEQGKKVGIIVAIGLCINILLNAWWVPQFGLHGAIVATSVAGVTILSITLFELNRSGVWLGLDSLAFALLPICILLGSLPAAVVFSVFLVLMGRTSWLVTKDEKRVLQMAITPMMKKLRIPAESLWPDNSLNR